MRRALRVGAVAVALALSIGLWFVHRLRVGPGPRTGDVEVAGLGEPVEILVDSLGVPHVWARSEADLFLAQGFLHASDRLWQMELFRRLPWGTLSELLGPAALPADRFMRTVGLGASADRSLAAVGPGEGVLTAYATGVNLAVAHWSGTLPPEFVALRRRPGSWAPVNSVALEKIMAWDLAEYHNGLELARARAALSDEHWALVEPGYPTWGITILGDSAGADGEPIHGGEAGPDGSPAASADLEDDLLASARVPPYAEGLIRSANTVAASNAWVVGGGRSASGKPLLANDMHLGLDQPALWYLMGLHAPGLDVVGMTLPGAPGVVAGHSAAVAWGFTNAMVDDADLFIERVAPDDPGRYLTPDGPVPFVVRTEVIPVRGGGADTLVVRETRHGPIVTPVDPRAGESLLSLRWMAHESASLVSTVLAMNRASSVAGLVDALPGFTNAHQNVVFADTAGAWGYWMAGRVPVRADGVPATLPVPGWTGEHDWVGWLDFTRHPHALEPARGYVVTANNRQGWDRVSAQVTRDWEPPYRARRIVERIEARALHDAASMADIQMDVTSGFVLRLLPAAVAAFRSAGLDREADALERWDGAATLTSTEATLFFAWVEALRDALREEAYGEPAGFMPDRAIRRALEGALPGVQALAADAASSAVAAAGGRPWGEAHQLSLGHPLEGVPFLGALLGFGKGPLPREGAPHAVNVAAYRGPAIPYRVSSGPSQRHVVDLADPDGSGGFILPGGQSGRAGNPHAWDQLTLWQEGRLWLLPLARERVEARTVRRFRLVPEPADG